MNSFQRERNRTSIRVLIGIVLLVGMIIVGRLYQLQVLEYDTYGPLSRENSLRQESVHPARGLILDKNGNLIADNEPVYTITITPANFDKKKIPLLAQLLNFSVDELEVLVKKAQKYSWQRSSKLIPEVNFEVFSKVEEHIWELPGIGHQIESKRVYPTSIKASHILGYLREISEQQYQRSNRYRLGDKAGTTGIENRYEEYLRGELGTRFVRINAYGQALGTYDNGGLDVSPSSGANIKTGLDVDLQKLAEELMVNKTGGIVAMDPRTGAIRAMVSAPDYDLSKLAGKIDNEYWAQINSDSTKPLFNRAITAMQPPGSTFKPLMALIGLKLGVITPKTTVYCNGAYVKGREYKCTGRHGEQDLAHAIQNSCNTYFFSLMNKIGTQEGLNAWTKLVNDFALGHSTGIDLPNEARGIVPDSAYFDRAFGKNKWGIGDVINLGVGQGAIGATPLQMATMVSMIANGGHKIKPHLVESVYNATDTVYKAQALTDSVTWTNKEALDLVRAGMRKVVTDGSARWYANIKYVEIAGKTGTAQNPHGRDHAWFVCYAPIDNPQLAVAVLVENAGFGSTSAAPIASLLMEKYFSGKVNRTWVYDRMIHFVPKDEDGVAE
ncbi:penicillin-binding protein 2 [bacterium]|nr:MAG: penicillin-binding protein 2 [bacterium]